MASFMPAGGSGTGGGLLYPDSADRPFTSNNRRNTWANNNKEDLIKDTTVVNVDGNQWYLYIGDSNPSGNVGNNDWMDAAEIVQGEQGIQGVSITTATIDGNGDLILDKSDGTEINAGRAKGDPGGKVPHVILQIADADLNLSTDGQTYDLANRGNFDGVWPAITPETEMSNGPILPDGPYAVVIDSAIPVDFLQEVNTAVDPNRVKQQISFFQGSRKTVFYREGVNSLAAGDDALGNSDWTALNMVPISTRDQNGIGFITARQLELGAGLNAEFFEDTAKIYSNTPWSDPVRLEGNDIDFPGGERDWTIDDLGRTIFYAAEVSREDTFKMPIDFVGYEGWGITIVVKQGTSSSLRFEVAGNTYVIPVGGTRIVWFENGGIETEVVGPFVRYHSSQDELAKFVGYDNAGWIDIPVGEHLTAEMVFVNLHPSINNEAGQLLFEVSNTNVDSSVPDGIRLISHEYTVIAPNNAEIHNKRFTRSGKEGADFITHEFEPVGTGSGGGSDPALGFTLNAGAEIAATDGNGNASDVLGFLGGGDFGVGPTNNEENTVIHGKDGLFANLEGDVTRRILLEGEGGGQTVIGWDLTTEGNNREVTADEGNSNFIAGASGTIPGLATLDINAFDLLPESTSIKMTLHPTYLVQANYGILRFRQQAGNLDQVFVSDSVTISRESDRWVVTDDNNGKIEVSITGATSRGDGTTNPTVFQSVEAISFEQGLAEFETDPVTNKLVAKVVQNTGIISSSSPLEVQRTGGGVHDAIGVTDDGKLKIGSPSAEISELELLLNQRRISVDRRNDDDTGQVFDQLAYTSDFVVPDPTWIEIDLNQASGQRFPLRGTNAQTGEEEDATEHDRAYISYNSSGTEYTYPVELTYVREKGSAVFVNQTIEYDAGQFFVTISQESTKKLHFTVGSSAKVNTSYVNQGNENVRFHSLMTGASSIDPGTYEFNVAGVKATAADVFTYNWDNDEHQETIQLSMVRDMFNGDYTVPSTSDRLRIVLTGDTYSLVVSSSIGGIGGVGFTTGYSGVTPVKNPQVERSEWHRAPDITVNPATLTDIILYQIEPFVSVPATGNRTTTLTFPSEAEFLATFYVPGVNEPQGDKPHIDSFQFKLWMDEVGTDEVNHEVVLKSNGDWLPFESYANDNTSEGIHHVIKKGNHATAVVHHFAFMKHEASSSFGPFNGYSLQTQREDLWYPLSEVPSTFDGDTVNTRTVMLADEGYSVADKRYPVIANVDLGKYQLVRLVDTAENTGGDYDTVTLGTVGEDASGFALAADGADESFADDVILQISSGVYPFDTAAAQVEDPIYVSDTGFVTLSTTPYRCGWVVAGDYIVLDVDLYNRSLAASTGGLQPDTDIEVTKVTLKNLANAGDESVLDITDDGDTEFNLSGTTTIRKVDKITRAAVDVMLIDGDSGEMTYQGAIIDDKAVVTKEYLEAFGRGIAVPSAVDVSGGNVYQQTTAVARFSTVGTDINDVIIEIDSELLESETIITMPSDSQVTTKNFDVVQVAGQGTSRSVKAGETWRVRMSYNQAGSNDWFWEKVVTGGGGVVYGLAGRNDIIEDPSVKAFAYVEGMPHHLLFETPATADQSAKARLVSNFPASKTFKFTPLAERNFEGVVAATSNEAGSPTLGQYSDIPLYCFEPNQVVSRDQVGFINWPSTVQVDVSEGFYVFGTVSGWAGGADRNGTTAVYVGRNADNPKGGGGKIGIALVADRLTILTGNGSEDADNATASQFNKESGVAHFYRYAFYVDRAGNLLYYVQDLNDGATHQGSTTANIASLNNDSRLYVAYDREGANTSTIAVGETTLVMNNEGLGEDRWNWRN